ncbi:MAG: GTP-binding protein [Candidatus Micrarchaeia archaeon]
MDVSKVVVLGHKDHGKSTLIGNLLISTKSVSRERINEAKAASKRLKRKFEPGFLLDSFYEEQADGLTIDMTATELKYKGKAFEFIDVPGHEELIKNMLGGASYAKLAVLVVSAKKGEGIRNQTKRHLFLARMMGIDKVVVAVNKMDSIRYSEKMFNEIRSSLEEFLEKLGFENKSIAFVPISAYKKDNLVIKSPNIRWYKGKTLMDAIDSYTKKENKHGKNKDLRMLIQGTVDENNSILITGKVLLGKIMKGDSLVCLPSGASFSVKGIVVKGKSRNRAIAGENVAIRQDKIGANAIEKIRGEVACKSRESKPKVSNIIKTLAFATEELNNKESVEIVINGNKIKARLGLEKIIDPTSMEEKKEESVKALYAAYVSMKLEKDIAYENVNTLDSLGRMVIYKNGKFSGIGVIKD